MRPSGWLLLCSLIVSSSADTAQNHESSSGFVHIQAVDVPYKANPDIPGLGYAVLSGDPDKEGIYVFRLKIPPGLTFPPHHHNQDRHVTVISGVWAFGTGYSGKCEDTTPLATGAYVFHPKEAPATPGLPNPKLPLGPGVFQRRMLASGKLDLHSTAVWLVPEPPAIGDQCAARTFHLPSSLTITCVARVR